MREKIIIFILITIVLILVIFLRTIFVRNGKLLENVVYKSSNLIIQKIRTGNRNLIIIGSGYSLSIDNNNRITYHDPFMIFRNIDIKNATIMSIFYPLEASGLEESGKELSNFINSISKDYDNITLIGHSKCGVCFANATKWIAFDNLKIITISAPFYGTPFVNKKDVFQKSNLFEKFIYSLTFSNHAVDKDIIPNSNFIQNADYSGLEKCKHINIISECPKASKALSDIFFNYVDTKLNLSGDGVIPRRSQYLSYPNTIEILIKANHATSFKIGTKKGLQ